MSNNQSHSMHDTAEELIEIYLRVNRNAPESIAGKSSLLSVEFSTSVQVSQTNIHTTPRLQIAVIDLLVFAKSDTFENASSECTVIITWTVVWIEIETGFDIDTHLGGLQASQRAGTKMHFFESGQECFFFFGRLCPQ